MDGITALNFARSRNSKDPTEGSDLARSRRQLLLIDAMAKKILTPKFFQSPSLVGQTYRYIRSSINTNISDAEILALIFATYPNTKMEQYYL
jgi:anionic cell wall polymer biosynthesis LytR-Cps2A-Psr (LCP) family protein